MTIEAFVDYLRSTHQRLPEADVTEAVELGLGGLKHQLKELSADPAVNPEQRLDTENGPTTIRELRQVNNRLSVEFSDFLYGAPLDLRTFILELKQHALLASGALELITEKHKSRQAEDAFQAASNLCSAADALNFTQQAYAAGFQKANDVSKIVNKQSPQRR